MRCLWLTTIISQRPMIALRHRAPRVDSPYSVYIQLANSHLQSATAKMTESTLGSLLPWSSLACKELYNPIATESRSCTMYVLHWIPLGYRCNQSHISLAQTSWMLTTVDCTADSSHPPRVWAWCHKGSRVRRDVLNKPHVTYSITGVTSKHTSYESAQGSYVG